MEIEIPGAGVTLLGNGAYFTVLSVAETLQKGDHVLVDGQLVSSKYEHENGKSRKTRAAKYIVFSSVRANSIRRLSRAEAELPAQSAAPEPGSNDAPF